VGQQAENLAFLLRAKANSTDLPQVPDGEGGFRVAFDGRLAVQRNRSGPVLRNADAELIGATEVIQTPDVILLGAL
jgi:hypothetical protein